MPESLNAASTTSGRHSVSLFLKLYAGMLLLIIFVSSTTWLALQEFNVWRAQQYREGVATGFFRLIAVGIANRQGLELQHWMLDVSHLLDLPLDLVSGRILQFSWMEQHRLDSGHAILRLNTNPTSADIYIAVPNHPTMYVHTRMNRVSEQQGEAMALLFLDAWQHANPPQNMETFKELGKYFSFPVTIQPYNQLRLNLEQKSRLDHNEVIMLLKQGDGPNTSSVRIMAPIPHRSGVLVLGPLYLFNWMPIRLIIVSGIVAILEISLGAYLLVRPLERRIRRMELAVRKLRSGDLAARADVDGMDEVGQLARVFNSMAEHTQRLIGAQREMLRAVSHELRTPVARIRFGVEMLASTDSATEREQQWQGIDSDIEELNSLVDEILTYARLEEEHPRLKISAFSLPQLFQRIVQETNVLRTGIRIDVNVQPHMKEVMAEERYIHRAVQNLVGNAIRYAHSQVLLSCGQNGHSHWLRVEDDGPGIPEVERERIFEAFARLDDSRTRASGGYGLGLSIVQKIVHWHEGSITVGESDSLGGAAFFLRWPVRLSSSIQERPLTQSNNPAT